VKVDVSTNYGPADEAKQILSLRMDNAGCDFVVGEVKIESDRSPKKPEI
jgi:hypothetical protein